MGTKFYRSALYLLLVLTSSCVSISAGPWLAVPSMPSAKGQPAMSKNMDAELKQAFIEVLSGMRDEFHPSPPPASILSRPNTELPPIPIKEETNANLESSSPALYPPTTSATKTVVSPNTSEASAPTAQEFVPLPAKKLPCGKTLAEVLHKAGVAAIFADENAKTYPATVLSVSYDSIASLAQELESQTGLFCVEDNSGLIISTKKMRPTK